MSFWSDVGQYQVQYVKFRMPTSENLIPIRVEVEVDDQPFKDMFCWHADEPESEIRSFARRLIEDEKLSMSFLNPIIQSIQTQVSDFRSFENQILSTEERVVPLKIETRVNHYLIKDQFLWDLGNFESDPEEFSRVFCKDMNISDPAVPVNLSFLIREQLLEAVKFSITGNVRESRFSKKIRRSGIEPILRQGTTALALMRRPNNKINVIRRAADQEGFQPIVEELPESEIAMYEAKEEKMAKLKRRQEETDGLGGRYLR